MVAHRNADNLKGAADFAKDASANLAELKSYAFQALQATQGLQEAMNAVKPTATGALQGTLNELQQHVDTFRRAAEQAANSGDFNAAKAQAGIMVFEARVFVLPLAQQLLVDVRRVGTVRGRVVDQSGRGIPGAAVTVAWGRYKRGIVTDANGFFTAANIPAIKPIEVKAYQTGYVYHEENTELAPGGVTTVQITLPRQGANAPRIEVGDFSVTPAGGGATLRMRTTHPQQDLAEDQIFALNPQLGIAAVLLHQGGDIYQTTVPFPPGGRWLFFSVDHACFSSEVVAVNGP